MTDGPGPGEPRRRGRPGRRAAERAAKLRREGEAGDATAPVEGGIRLNKLLATRGIGARRKCDALIQAGSVRVNGKVVKEPGTQVMADRDRVEVHGRPIPGRAALRYLMIHKPVGVITTLDDPEGRPTVRTLLPPGPRLFPVGRLDAETSGLIIATNDGELAHHLMHPRYGVRKLYRARLDRPPDADQVRRLRSGVMFEPGRMSAPCEVRVRNARLERAEVEIALHEGRYRQVRRMCEAVGLRVERLHRPEYGPLKLGTLPRGAWRELSADEVRKLRAASARPVARVTRKRVAASSVAGSGEATPIAAAPPRGRRTAPRHGHGGPRPDLRGAGQGSASRPRTPFKGAPASGRRTTSGPVRAGGRPEVRGPRPGSKGGPRTRFPVGSPAGGRTGDGPRRGGARPAGRPGQRTGPGGPARPRGPVGRSGKMRVGRPSGGRPGRSSPKRRGPTY